MSEATIFAAALEKATDEERAAYVAEACGGDDKLRRRVEALLRAHAEADDVLDPRSRGERTGAYHPAGAAAGTVIGPYKLAEQIGEGGMGEVWLAQQQAPVKRLVALKLVKPGMDSRSVLARFEAERQALALMDHPHIAKIFDAGATSDGRPYFVMELVKGTPLTRYCDEQRLTPRQRLELFVPVCQAIQHAHQKGIIHRDIKPSNVLVANYDGQPVPKVIDFGIAKATGQQLTDHTLVTGLGAVVGTLEYMSPEQAEHNQLDIDTRSDIYSLGVLLYELLTGTTPLDKKRLKEAAVLELLRLIREEEPPRPSTRLSESKDALPAISAQRQMEPARLTKLVRGELDWIVMKALEKDRGRRYESANGFAMDVQRYLADEPVQACPPSVGYRFRKLVRRNKAAFTAAALVLTALLVATAVSTWQAIRATTAEGLAEDRLGSERLALASEKAARDAERQTRGALDKARGEKEQQQTRINRELTAALLEVTRLREKVRTALPGDANPRNQLRETLRAAQTLAANESADPVLAQRVQALVAEVRQDDKDRRMVAKIEEILWQSQAESFEGVSRMIGSYWPVTEAAFREYGIPITEFGVFGVPIPEPVFEEAARRIQKSAIHDWLVAALDHCAEHYYVEQLLSLAQHGEKDPWRQQYFAARRRGARSELARLAERPEALVQPTPILCSLARWLGDENRSVGITMLRAAQRRHPADPMINCALAQQLVNVPMAVFERDKWIPLKAEAVGYLRAAIALRPDSPGIRRTLFDTLILGENYAEAEAMSREEIERRPDDSAGYDNLAKVFFWKKDWDRAIAAYRKSVSKGSTSAQTYWFLGRALEVKGDLNAAIPAYREASKLAPGDTHHLEYWARALHARGDLDDAIALYRKGVELTRGSSRYGPAGSVSGYGTWQKLSACLCQALWDKGDYAAAIASYEKAIGTYEEKAVADKKSVQPADPGGFRNDLAFCLATCPDVKFRDPARAVELARKAVDSHPADPRWRATLGVALYRAGDYKAAAAELKTALSTGPNAVGALFLAMCHHKLGDRKQALQSYSGAIHGLDRAMLDRYKQSLNDDQYNNAIRGLDRALGSMAWFKRVHNSSLHAQEFRRLQKEAEELLKEYPEMHFSLGGALRARGQLDAATAAYREAIRLKEDYAEAHCDLGNTLRQKGEFREALEELRRGDELGSQEPGWRHPSAEWVRQCEYLLQLDAKLSRVLKGEVQPANAHERQLLAQLCQLPRRSLHATAARFYQEAFGIDAKLADIPGPGLRYYAASAAALAGCGQGKDVGKLVDNDRAALRGQALDWLRADLKAKRLLLENEANKAGPFVLERMQHWLANGDFSGVRGPEALAKLPEPERQPWQQLWDDVADTLKRAQQKAAPEKRAGAN
jgi:serine/threonine protein kinase/tetratricopeptide (TPR) repeat protein